MEKYKKKIVAVMNGKIEIGAVMNALAHMSIGLGASIENKEDLRLVDYKDGDEVSHPNLSELPFIICKAKGSSIKDLRQKLIERKVNFVDFPDFVNLIGTFDDSNKSQEFKEKDINYYGLVIFDDWDVVNELTKKYTLWK
ncbi:DUF2000 domain-containing protein [Candidatus Woesearchaeota archaeon]|nr:DUF2000 domain-containing protein [Candidatus Woesearchaeota archaeon]MBW3022216.1 DUF2000 domain-containing protein [Candidatus Woesearchaeota archaeon]